jgi:hypothetical protein
MCVFGGGGGRCVCLGEGTGAGGHAWDRARVCVRVWLAMLCRRLGPVDSPAVGRFLGWCALWGHCPALPTSLSVTVVGALLRSPPTLLDLRFHHASTMAGLVRWHELVLS